ncbi:hypothetical protein BS47DRAFT_1367520 [Hydnum rufescens UP504]|uniref:Uncharacterized protein n=1 Tax=Hydnum rufescens UP504 TaxID=1448309 RepID=A0A9P6DKK7_9AGAM|nr:hypothetical protein BS47DRAFT_1367520 [Hydnum rufescens UP504]
MTYIHPFPAIPIPLLHPCGYLVMQQCQSLLSPLVHWDRLEVCNQVSIQERSIPVPAPAPIHLNLSIQQEFDMEAEEDIGDAVPPPWLKPVHLGEIELVQTLIVLDVKQLLQQQMTHMAMQVGDAVFRGLELIEGHCLVCLCWGIMMREHKTVECERFPGVEQFYGWKKRMFLDKNEEGYCYHCLFDADDGRHMHRVGDGKEEHCRFEDVVGPLGCMVRKSQGLRKRLGSFMGDSSLEEVEGYERWLLKRLGDNHRETHASTRLVRWFYDVFKGKEMPEI